MEALLRKNDATPTKKHETTPLGSNTYLESFDDPCFDCSLVHVLEDWIPKLESKKLKHLCVLIKQIWGVIAMDLPPHIGFQECKRIEGSNIGGASQLAGDERASILGFPRKDRYTLWMNPNIKHVMAVTFAPQVLTCMDLLKSFARFQGRESSASLLWKAGLSGFDESASRMWSSLSFQKPSHQGAEKDHELILQNVVQEKAKYFRAVRRLFAQWLGEKFVDEKPKPAVDVFFISKMTSCGDLGGVLGDRYFPHTSEYFCGANF